MTVLLDHLTAIVVGVVLLGALAVLQLRSQDTAIEATQQHQAAVVSGEFASTIERELENVRLRGETEMAFALVAGAPAFSRDVYRFRLRQATLPDGTEYTAQVTFPTLVNPADGPRSEIHIVTYEVRPTGATGRVDGRERAFLQATRSTFARGGPIEETMAFDGLVDLDVTVFVADGHQVTETELLAEAPVRIRVASQQAHVRTGTRAAASNVASITHARTVRIPGVDPLGPMAVDLGLPGGIPLLPGDPGYDPTREPTATPLPDPPDPGTGAPDPGAPDPGAPDPGAPDPGAPDPGAPDPGAPDTPTPYDPAEWQDDRRDPESSVPLCRDGVNLVVNVTTVSTYTDSGYSRGECLPPSGDGSRAPSDPIVVCNPLGGSDYDSIVIQWRELDTYLAGGAYRGECDLGDDP